MSQTLKIFLLLIFCSLFLISQETQRTVVFYNKNGEEFIVNFNDIESLKLDLIDTLSHIHIYYKNNVHHFIHSGKWVDSITFNHENYTISLIKNNITETHYVDSIKCIKINCEKLIIPDDPINGYANPDSVMVDSCQNPPVGLCYRWFIIEFKYYTIDLPPAPKDTSLDVTWESISSTYTQLRNDFEEMENKFGGYILRKGRPEITDSTHIGSKTFFIAFNNYISADSVVNFLQNIQGLSDFYYKNRVGIDVGINIPEYNKGN
jgi:hypothetical protein